MAEYNEGGMLGGELRREGVDWVASGRRGRVSKERVRRHEARTMV